MARFRNGISRHGPDARRQPRRDVRGDCHRAQALQSWQHVSKAQSAPVTVQIHPFAGTLVVPRFGNKRILNEAAAMQFIAGKTNIPVPKLHACFEDSGAAYPVIEYVSGETMSELRADDRKVVEMELGGFLWTLRALTSDALGGPSGIVSSCHLVADLVEEFNLSNAGCSAIPRYGPLAPSQVEDEAKAVKGSCVLPQ